MGFRYLLAIAQSDGAFPVALDSVATSARLNCAKSNARLRLYLNEPVRWARLANENSLVIGDIFRRGVSTNARIKNDAVATGINTFEDILLKCWGSYVAVCGDPTSMSVMRDPSGALPAYHIDHAGVRYVASDAPLLVETGLLVADVDWSQVARSLFQPDLAEGRTAILGLASVLPGMALTFGADGARSRLCWAPIDFCMPSRPDLPALRRTIMDCVQVQADGSPLVIGMSGGLDSSIVTLGARRVSDLQAVTVSADDVRGNEEIYAAALCRAFDIPLHLKRYAAERVDLGRPALPHRPCPSGMVQLQAYDAAIIDVLSDVGASSFMSGVGGDNVFQSTRSARPLADCLAVHGLGRTAFRTLKDICRLTGAGPWRAFREARRVSGGRYAWPRDARMLHPDAVMALQDSEITHPWLENMKDGLPGKQSHVAMLVRAHSYLECHDRRLGFSSIHPLMSQPIIEQCLAMPSWLACKGGVDRAYIRSAFAADLPDIIAQRRVKGGPDGFNHNLVRSNRETIRAILLDGLLARERIIDRHAVESALTERALLKSGDHIRLLLLLDAEAWARHWTDGGGAGRA